MTAPARTAAISPAQAAYEAHGQSLFADGVYFCPPNWEAVGGVWEKAWRAGADKAIAASGLQELAAEMLAAMEGGARFALAPEDQARFGEWRERAGIGESS